MISGGQIIGVPILVLQPVLSVSHTLHAPRSPILSTPLEVIKIFSAFKSRCMTFLSCKYFTPRQTWVNNDNTSFSVKYSWLSFLLFKYSYKSPLSTYSMTMLSWFLLLPETKTSLNATIFGWYNYCITLLSFLAVFFDSSVLYVLSLRTTFFTTHFSLFWFLQSIAFPNDPWASVLIFLYWSFCSSFFYSILTGFYI